MSDSQIKIGAIYRHYKDATKEYEIIGIAKHSETLEDLVIYRGLYDSEEFGKNPIWARPVKMFLGKVAVDGKEVQRFEYIRG